MPKLYEPIQIGALSLKNRVVMAPLTRNRSPRAVPNDLNVEYYRQRAGAGLIVTEATPVSHQGQGYADVPGLYLKESLDGWKKVTEAVHQAGGKIVVQMWHVGRISHTSLQPGGGKPVAPSAITAKSKTFIFDENGNGQFVPTSEPRALELSEIPGIVEDYRKAARAAIDAGFDGVEVHAANGYLIDQFLRNGSNQRTDEYGGSIENRTRFLREVMDAVTAEIGAERTGIRISPVTPANDAADSDPQPLFTRVVEILAAYNLAYIHVIEGATGGDRAYSQGEKPFDWAALREAYRKTGGKAAWMANNGYDKASAEEAVENGKADLIAFGRPFIANPDLVDRLKKNAPLAEGDKNTFYGGGATGYTDYPVLENAEA
jgi:N-ethylmaleimide reductase